MDIKDLKEVKKLQYLVIIGTKKKKDNFISLLLENGARAINTVYAKGSVNSSLLAKALGFDVEEDKIVITCLIPTEQAKKTIDLLYNKYNFKKPNTGIAYCVSVEGLAF